MVSFARIRVYLHNEATTAEGKRVSLAFLHSLVVIVGTWVWMGHSCSVHHRGCD